MQTGEGEALRNDTDYMYVAAWEYLAPSDWKMNKEVLK